MDIYEKKSQMRKERQEQEELRKKYDIKEEVVVKETSNMGKFMIKSIGGVIRIIATVAVLILAAIGIITLIYPESRQILFETIREAFEGLL